MKVYEVHTRASASEDWLVHSRDHATYQEAWEERAIARSLDPDRQWKVVTRDLARECNEAAAR